MAKVEPQRQVGAIPLIWKKGRARVVLITSSSGKWIFPKGRIEPDLSARAVVRMEAYEEAGVKGGVAANHLIEVQCHKSNGPIRLRLWPMSVGQLLGTWPEMHHRERVLVRIDDALELISDPALREALEQNRAELERFARRRASGRLAA